MRELVYVHAPTLLTPRYRPVEVLVHTKVGREVKRLRKHGNPEVARMASNLCAKLTDIVIEGERRQRGVAAGPCHRITPGAHPLSRTGHTDIRTQRNAR